MSIYQVLVDVSRTWEENDIDVLTFQTQGETAKHAEENFLVALKDDKYQNEIDGREVYVWSVTEEDRL